MQNLQNKLVTMVQDMHQKVNEMHTDWTQKMIPNGSK